MREMAQLYQDTLTMADEFQSYFVPEESFETQASDAKNLLNYFFFLHPSNIRHTLPNADFKGVFK